jgi:starch phosphorylase
MDVQPEPNSTVPASLDTPASPEAVEALREAIVAKLRYSIGKTPSRASQRDWFVATALIVRDRVIDTWAASARQARATGAKRVHYFSLEFLIGRLLFDAAGNLGMIEPLRAALRQESIDLDHLRTLEPDAALGNGGLGRLAACFMESMATLGIPAFGYGIRYDNGLFRQAIVDGWQQERPEDWLSSGNPWEFQRPELSYRIGFGGSVAATSEAGHAAYHWTPSETVFAVAFDTPVVGYGGKHANTLRLWSARAADPLLLDAFNRGDHVGALTDRMRAESISRVLYPGDDSSAGQELRLRQEYFFASASLQDLIRRHLVEHDTVHSLAEHAAVQLNDTHPAIGIAELMRLLIDVYGLEWEPAWAITQACVSYTNHTLLPEALEMWPVLLLERMLPRHMQIIYLLNARHLDTQRARGADDRLLAALSLIDEGSGRRVRMGHLAFLGSHSVNGVSALHTDLMRRTTFRDLDAAVGGRIVNRTNGITFRRWLHQTNPGLTRLLTDTLGERVLHDPMALADLAPYADDAGFREAFQAQRLPRKQAMVRLVAAQLGLAVNPDALFDVQIKRIHEYKRQLLNVLDAISQYNAIRAQPTRDWRPRVKFFAGKAAPSYTLAKQIIRLVHDVARVVNGDPTVRGLLQVVFMPNYNVSLAELLIPAADLSEQISTAGMEASGTGNMKLALNGALTIGTLDGANVEIRERVGADNMFIFGMTTEEVEARRHSAGLDASGVVNGCPALRAVLDAMRSGLFSPEEPARYVALADRLEFADPFFVCADFDAYDRAQETVDAKWRDPAAWWRSAVLNTANMGWFSSDRTIGEYAEGTWQVESAAAP